MGLQADFWATVRRISRYAYALANGRDVSGSRYREGRDVITQSDEEISGE